MLFTAIICSAIITFIKENIMKKLTMILMILLCTFSLSAEWGRIQYIDEFGDVDPTISNPYQIANGTREASGKTNRYYEYRMITSLPTEFGYLASIELDMFDDFDNYVVFDADDEATIKVKLDSGEIKEFSYNFTEHEYSWYDEYELDQVRQNIYLDGHDAVDLLNELYNGSDLRFVIYNGNIKYTFTMNADGFKDVADDFIDNFAVPTEPDIYDNGSYASVSHYFMKTAEGTDFVLGLHSMGYPKIEEYPSLSVSLNFKDSDDVFWYDNKGEYTFKAVNLISANGKDVLSLSDGIENDEYSSYFSLYERIPEIIDFANVHGSVNLKIEFNPSVEFDIPLTAKEVQKLLNFPER